MNKYYHVLNGDALAERFPSSIKGETIIMRECLVDGPVLAASYEEFLQLRSRYLDTTYPDYAPDTYEDYVASQLSILQEIPELSIVYLWFEKDVFCQVNAWFILNQFSLQSKNLEIYWVLPTSTLHWGFAGMDNKALQSAFENATPVNTKHEALLSRLWHAFSKKDLKTLNEILNSPDVLEFVKPAVEAVIGEIESEESKELIREIVSENNNPTFGKVFKEFHSRGAIYGYGDLLVKRMFDEIIQN
ncbi:MAG: DUF1835 domain-containing protein [Cyanothece sp. SIO1E1]|nr:DUF1835 domain-containing protein [Cyanothece sp. SIO1E1]